ncbi:hypothetical protein P170DRAFT_474741 [Aspergillus steynii IBT 23096]|uniref:Uncharacterized protein n=1 Tax=Aspergillus steynii IBT 23096 TaxID=1392250 RepID=A0A2I2GE82_9EURO|nr:uncharacterized protein P170DRAFT_474741 [Aspergillus steynii IBT 23096]PLB51194.1 hypothetical protein P170DRAFT_474741 [Aspergillus steynii IBT 23096]
MGLFNFFKSSSNQQQEQQPQQATWDPNTLTMQQPSCPTAPSTERVVTEQPNSEQNMKLRGGGGGDLRWSLLLRMLRRVLLEPFHVHGLYNAQQSMQEQSHEV